MLQDAVLGLDDVDPDVEEGGDEGEVAPLPPPVLAFLGPQKLM